MCAIYVSCSGSAHHENELVQVGLQRPDLELMLQRLEEFEVSKRWRALPHTVASLPAAPCPRRFSQKEEGRVRERWRSITYEDSYHPGGSRVAQTQPQLGGRHCNQFHIPLPHALSSSIHSYRHSYERYLSHAEKRTGAWGGVKPCQLIER